MLHSSVTLSYLTEMYNGEGERGVLRSSVILSYLIEMYNGGLLFVYYVMLSYLFEMYMGVTSLRCTWGLPHRDVHGGYLIEMYGSYLI